jgi:hypothetical protein
MQSQEENAQADESKKKRQIDRKKNREDAEKQNAFN